MVSHLVKQALLNIAADTRLEVAKPKTRRRVGRACRAARHRSIHIAERGHPGLAAAKKPANSSTPGRSDGFVSRG